jgi:hypothetical protein
VYGLTAEKDKVKRFLLGEDIPVLVFALIYVPAPLFTTAQHKRSYNGHKLNETYNKPTKFKKNPGTGNAEYQTLCVILNG